MDRRILIQEGSASALPATHRLEELSRKSAESHISVAAIPTVFIFSIAKFCNMECWDTFSPQQIKPSFVPALPSCFGLCKLHTAVTILVWFHNE